MSVLEYILGGIGGAALIAVAVLAVRLYFLGRQVGDLTADNARLAREAKDSAESARQWKETAGERLARADELQQRLTRAQTLITNDPAIPAGDIYDMLASKVNR